MANTVKDYSQMIGWLTRDKTTDVPGSMAHGLRTGLYDGGRAAFNNGQLVQPSVDGSRPGYGGDKYSELINTSVEDLKKLGFTGVKGTKKGNPGGYYKLTEEFKEWVRNKTREDPTYGKKELKDQPGRKRVYDLIIKAVKNKNPGYLLEKGAQNKTNTDFKEFDYLTIEKIKNDPLVTKQFKEYSGLKQNQINKIFKDREELKTKNLSARGELNQLNRPDLTEKRKFYEKAEKWILRNSKTYVDPENFYNAFVKKFGKDNHLVQAIEGKLTTITDATRKNRRGMVKPNFSDDFMTEVLGQATSKKGARASVPIENLKDLFRTTIYTNNPDVRQRILDTFTDIIPETLPGKSGLLELRERLTTDPILKKYNLNGAIRGPIAKLLANDLNQITLEDIASFKRPIVGTTDILKFLGTRVDPKYKSMFEEATKAITYAQKNQWPLAKKAINSSQAIQFDHKIPVALINEGFADDIDYIKVTPTSKKFNSEIKRDMFDAPLKRLANEFKLKTTTLDRKAEIFEEMKFLRDNFNKKYGNYLDSINIDFNKKTGDIKFTNIDKPVTKKTDLVSSLADSLKKEGKISETKIKQLQNLVSKGGAKGKAAARALSIIAAGVGGYKMEDILKGTGLMDKEYELTASAGDAPLVEKGLSTGEKAAAGTGAALGIGTKLGRKALGTGIQLATGPTGIAGLTYALRPEGGYDLRRTGDRIGFELEAALAPTLVKGVTDISSKIKNPLFRKGLETLTGVRIPGIMTPTNLLRAARVASPLGIASLAGEGLYALGKKGYEQRKLMETMTEKEKRDFLADQYEDLGGVFGEGA